MAVVHVTSSMAALLKASSSASAAAAASGALSGAVVWNIRAAAIWPWSVQNFGGEFDIRGRVGRHRNLETTNIDQELIFGRSPSIGLATAPRKFAFSKLWMIFA